MTEEIDRKTIGASELGNRLLSRLASVGLFPEEMDAYRFAVGLGLARRKRTPVVGRRTKWNVGSFDRDETVAGLVATLMPETAGEDPYRVAEELAETGFAEMEQAVMSGEFRFTDFFSASYS